MTITPATMYWFTRLDGITIFFSVLTVLGGFAFVFLLIFFVVSKVDDSCEEPAKRAISILLKTVTPIWLFAIIGVLFTPTTKEMAMIYVVPQITESQVVKQDIPELYDLGVNALKDWLKQTKGGDNE
jgi:hypothetical protein